MMYLAQWINDLAAIVATLFMLACTIMGGCIALLWVAEFLTERYLRWSRFSNILREYLRHRRRFQTWLREKGGPPSTASNP